MFHAPHNTAMFLAAVGSLIALTQLVLEGSDLHIATLFDEADDDVARRPASMGPPAAGRGLSASVQGQTSLHPRGLALLSTLTNLRRLSLQGSCCWRMLSDGAGSALLSLTSVTQLAICVHASDAYRSVRTPRWVQPYQCHAMEL